MRIIFLLTKITLQKIIKFVNLEKRTVRKHSIISQLERENITNYEFIEAVDGKIIESTEQLSLLFERNDFNYKKGVIGCVKSAITFCSFFSVYKRHLKCKNV